MFKNYTNNAYCYLQYKRIKSILVNYKIYKQQQLLRTKISEEGYSYRPFDETKSIFIHIPKCAGVSVNETLYNCLAGGHTTLRGYENIFSPSELLSYFKFTIVRNPWDRVVSAYNFLVNGGMNESDRIWAQQNIMKYANFNQFVREWVNQDNIIKYYHFMPQHKFFLSSHKNLKIDFYAFIENFEEDFKVISERLNLSCEPQRKNQSSHTDYKDYYDSTTREIIASVYQRDIELLGYDFTNSRLQQQIEDRNLNKLPYILD